MSSKRKKQSSILKKAVTSIILILIVSVISIFLIDTYNKIEIKNPNYETEKLSTDIKEKTVEEEENNNKTISEMIAETMESVVGISKLKNNGDSIFSSKQENSLGLGTGIIVSNNGYILSNEHVTGKTFSICYITLNSGTEYTGNVVWSDSDLDLSILKIDAKNLKPILLGDSNKIKVGENVYAIGNPIGFEFRRTVTSGIISAKNRSIKLEEDNKKSYMSNLIQTDATINPGNSGGPLILPNGEVIGINTIKISTADNIGFAIPINVVKQVIKSFKENNKFDEPTLGIFVYDKNVLPYLDTNILRFTKGIYVAEVIPNGPSYKILQEGDVINLIDNKEINSMNELREYLFTKKVGDQINLKITRNNILKTLTITLRKK